MQRLCSLVGLAGLGYQACHLVRFYEGVDLDCLHIDRLEKGRLGLADGKVLLYIRRHAVHLSLARRVQAGEPFQVTAHA